MSATATAPATAAEWTCGECQMTSRWLQGNEPPELPPHWTHEGGEFYCLACRRQRAAQAGLDAAPAEATGEERVKLRRTALIEFEIERDPDRSNGEIARVARCSVPAVLKVRKQLEAAAR
jgi:hypothetical protein